MGIGSTRPDSDELYARPVTLRLIIAEDSLLVREGVAKLLAEQEGVEVVALCADYDELMAAVDDHPADVVLTDIRMPPTGTDEGIRAASELRVTHPELGVVVLSQYAEPEYALALLESGSEGRAYLLKERVSEPDQLLGAVRDVARGGSVVDPKVVEGLVTARSRSRQHEVLAEIAQGRNNAAVASTLGLSDRAVEKHINSLFAKLGLSEEPDIHRRVKAVLLYLAEKDEGGTAPP